MTTLVQRVAPMDRECLRPLPDVRKTHGIYAGMAGGVVVLIAIFVTACASAPVDEPMLPPLGPTPTTGPTWQIGDASADVHEIGDKLPVVQKKVEVAAADIAQKTPAKSLPAVQPSIDGLNSAAGMIPPLTRRAGDAERKLAVATEQAAQKQLETDWWISYGKGMDAKLAEVQAAHVVELGKKDDVIAARDKQIERANDKSFKWMITAGLVCCAAGVALFFSGQVWGRGIGIGGFVLSAAALLLQQVEQWAWVAWALMGSAGLLVVIKFGIDLFVKKYSLNRVVGSMQSVKAKVFDPEFIATAGGVSVDVAQAIATAQCDKAFGDDGIAATVQGHFVTGIVRRILGKPALPVA